MPFTAQRFRFAAPSSLYCCVATFSLAAAKPRHGMGPEEKQQKKCCPLRRSRKGCMKGKGGPENQACNYRGVRQRTWGKWVAEIREPNRGARLWLGTFSSSLEAAQAYDKAARSLYGDCARLNLSDDSGPRRPSAKLEASCSPTCSTETSTSESRASLPGSVQSPAGYFCGGSGLDDFDDYVTGLPKAEDFGLEAFSHIPLFDDVGVFAETVFDKELLSFDPMQLSWCF
ncbi:hypothetical protein BHM03_00050243 [Ensete ventricosum]|nr:hypothetical protein BHM03_00050243 [Ensete ventricosum]